MEHDNWLPVAYCVVVVQCLVEFNSDLVCSGGADLCLWDSRGRLMVKCDRSGLEETSRSLLRGWAARVG